MPLAEYAQGTEGYGNPYTSNISLTRQPHMSEHPHVKGVRQKEETDKNMPQFYFHSHFCPLFSHPTIVC